MSLRRSKGHSTREASATPLDGRRQRGSLPAMIKVHKFGPAFGLPDLSPFVLKVETYLRLTDQKYDTVLGDLRKAPRGQLPLIEIDGKIVPDSTRIVESLESSRAEKLDAHLDASERAIALAFKSMLEEHLYFGLVFMRWATDDGWSALEPSLRDMLKGMGIPSLMHGIVTATVRKKTVERARKQGIGRAPRAEVVQECNEILDALAERLGSKAFFCGDRPTTYDATVYAFTRSALLPAFDNEVRRHAAGKKNLVDYAGRLEAKYWKS